MVFGSRVLRYDQLAFFIVWRELRSREVAEIHGDVESTGLIWPIRPCLGVLD
jgi:hypothetical protein